MKIAHICLAASYTEGMAYQENIIPDLNRGDGHDVLIVTDCHYYDKGVLIEIEPGEKILDNGIKLIRLRYTKVVWEFLSKKIRKVSGLYAQLERFQPDVILFHGAAGWEILTVTKYKKDNPKIKLFIDSHEDFYNSGRNFLSRIVQYILFNRIIINISKSSVEKFLYVSSESKIFLQKMYGLQDQDLEFFPLGGNVIPYQEKINRRNKIIKKHGFDDDVIIFFHSGKLVKGKRTEELLKAFSLIKNNSFRLIISGYISSEMVGVLMPLIEADARVLFVGWTDYPSLIDYLCAANLYIQPGTQSATLQAAVCAGTPIAVYPYESHRPYLKGNGYFISSQEDMVNMLTSISSGSVQFEQLVAASYDLANTLLDYQIIARRICN